MAGLFLVRGDDPDFAQGALGRARAQFGLHGFRNLTERCFGGWHFIHAPHIIGGPDSLLEQGEDLVAVAGTFTCDGQTGRPALEALLKMALPEPDWTRLGGQFVALVRKGRRTYLFTDYFAAFQLFHDCEQRLFSTSLLSAAAALPRLSWDKQAVYEFAFNVVPLGEDTLFSELKMLGPETVAELTPERSLFHKIAKPLPETTSAMPLAQRIERHRERLGKVVHSHLSGSERVFAPLSGGLDSRLVLAALRAQGCRPNVYVYGSPGSSDVEVARGIGQAECFEVEWIDKDAWPKGDPEAYPERVERTFHEFDGFPSFGDLFDYGADAAARDARHAGGALAASGGCGEVYRNFFFLPDRPLRAATVALSFFGRYSAGDATSEFNGPDFLRIIEDKILAALGASGQRGKLPRTLIEQVYPRLRCRSFFGKEISLEGRYGPYLMPFLDHQIVAEGISLPIRLKNAGRFEATLLNAIDPSLARHPSAYGHDFASPPGFRHRFNEWSTRVRPAWLRQKSYALKRKLGRPENPYDVLPPDDYIGRVVDQEFPIMRRFFRPERIHDSSVIRRIACLEYVAVKLGSKLHN